MGALTQAYIGNKEIAGFRSLSGNAAVRAVVPKYTGRPSKDYEFVTGVISPAGNVVFGGMNFIEEICTKIGEQRFRGDLGDILLTAHLDLVEKNKGRGKADKAGIEVALLKFNPWSLQAELYYSGNSSVYAVERDLDNPDYLREKIALESQKNDINAERSRLEGEKQALETQYSQINAGWHAAHKERLALSKSEPFNPSVKYLDAQLIYDGAQLKKINKKIMELDKKISDANQGTEAIESGLNALFDNALTAGIIDVSGFGGLGSEGPEDIGYKNKKIELQRGQYLVIANSALSGFLAKDVEAIVKAQVHPENICESIIAKSNSVGHKAVVVMKVGMNANPD